MVDTVWVARHGQRADSDPDWRTNAERVHDPPLTDHGRWEAWRLGRRLAATGVAFDAVYASPFLRCVETADEICRELECSFDLEPGLGEHRNAEWFDADPEILSGQTLVERFEPCRDDSEPAVVPEFPESHDVAERRVGEATQALLERHPGDGHLLLVGHGLTVGGVVRELVGSTDWVDAPLAGLTRIERRGADWHLCFSGDTLHLV